MSKFALIEALTEDQVVELHPSVRPAVAIMHAMGLKIGSASAHHFYRDAPERARVLCLVFETQEQAIDVCAEIAMKLGVEGHIKCAGLMLDIKIYTLPNNTVLVAFTRLTGMSVEDIDELDGEREQVIPPMNQRH